MKRIVLATAAVTALGAPALMGSASAGSGPPTGTLELVQLERDTRSGFVDNVPRRRESSGDVFTIRGRVLDAGNRSAGRVQAVFTQTGRRHAHGSATFALAAGQIVIVGGLAGRGDDTLVVAGGTGAYAGATGTAQVTEERGRTRFRFAFGG